MASLYLYENQLLLKNNALAISQDCCCEDCKTCGSESGDGCYGIAPDGVPTGCSGSPKPYPRCAGLIYFGVFTGNAPDRFVIRANNGSGAVLLDTGCVQYGKSDWRTNPSSIVFGGFYIPKPAGVTAINIQWIPCQSGSYALRVGNCLAALT